MFGFILGWNCGYIDIMILFGMELLVLALSLVPNFGCYRKKTRNFEQVNNRWFDQAHFCSCTLGLGYSSIVVV